MVIKKQPLTTRKTKKQPKQQATQPGEIKPLGSLTPDLVRLGDTVIIGGLSDYSGLDVNRMWFERVIVIGWYCSGKLVEIKSTEKDHSWTDIREASKINVYAVL